MAKKLTIFVLLFMIGCTSPEKDFNRAKKEHTVESYKNFLIKYPQSEFAEIAKKELERAKFDQAYKINTMEAYTDFINLYPLSQFLQDVKNKMCKIELDSALQKNEIVLFKKLLSNYPNSEYEIQIKEKILELTPKLNILFSIGYEPPPTSQFRRYPNINSFRPMAEVGLFPSALSNTFSQSKISLFSPHTLTEAMAEKNDILKHKRQIPNKYLWIHFELIQNPINILIGKIHTPGTVTSWTNKKASIEFSRNYEGDVEYYEVCEELLSQFSLPSFELFKSEGKIDLNSSKIKSYFDKITYKKSN